MFRLSGLIMSLAFLIVFVTFILLIRRESKNIGKKKGRKDK